MAISTIQLYVAFSKLFKTDEPEKKQVLQFGVGEAEFDAIDRDQNEYLNIDEALQNNAVAELLYSSMVSTYGAADADEAQKNAPRNKDKTSMVDSINPEITIGNNPFI